VEAGLTWLKTNQQTVNALNVFPVPDGDTGTNMSLTMNSAWSEIKDSGEKHVGHMAALVAKGALMGARGNSGVILSQLWRGFARALQDQELIDGPGLVRGLAEARDTAYKGVVKPVEGTILTVAKDTAAGAEAALAKTQDPIEILERCLAAAEASVEHTPELLPVLKQAGVVDAGGQGLFYILEGCMRHIQGAPLDVPLVTLQPLSAFKFDNAMEAVEEGQDYEVVVDFFPNKEFELRKFYDRLEQMGTSIQVGEGEGMYRMHIHVPLDKRYEPVDYVMSIGTITKVAMENLVAQMEDIHAKTKGMKLELAKPQPGQIGVVAVSPGAGLRRIFASLGWLQSWRRTDYEPSTQEILAAFENPPRIMSSSCQTTRTS
jgi:DAK2 domain fusion protein YloV